jgi:phospho-N-acetylmuramoyl-pentapeptide-transferase
MFFLAAWSNAVNLTDGLDGLAISTFTIAAAAFTALTYIVGHREFAEYLLLQHFSAVCGADHLLWRAGRGVVGFPLVQLVSRRDLHGRCRVARARSRDWNRRDSDQAGAPAGDRGRRLRARGVFRDHSGGVIQDDRPARIPMAPLHHHFELVGWSEPKVITRFVIVAIIFALFSLTTLKLR